MGSQIKTPDELDISFALSPNDPEGVPALIQNIASLGKDHATHRLELLAEARALVRALETPQETMIKHLWGDGITLAVLASGVEMGLFKHLAQNDGRPEKAADIGTALAIETGMLSRLLRHMAAMGYLVQTGADEYKTTRFSRSLSIPVIADGYPQNLDTIFPALGIMPSYFTNLGLTQPVQVKGLFQQAHNTDKSFFEFLYSRPRSAEQFHHAMDGFQQGQARWFDPGFYSVDDSLITGADTTDPDAVFLVDVGGSTGHDITRFHQRHPDVPGRLVLQDLPEVVEGVDLGPGIEVMGKDFFVEGTVKGARAYYMHSVLHDWPDDKCRDILTRVKEAMRPGYSNLLIQENVIFSTGASWQTTSLDIMMFVLNGAGERTEAAWRLLLEGAGLRICKIWSTPNSLSSLIECEVA